MSTDFLALGLFSSINANTAAKSHILNYMWTAANFFIEGRMRPYGRRLCTVGIEDENTIFSIAWKMKISKRHE